MSPHTWLRCLSIGSRCRLLAAFAVTLSTLLSLAAPRVHAQDWDGSVEVSTGSLEVPVGGAVSYRVRLSKPPTQDGWWIILRVDGDMRADGEYAGIRWVPSVGWEFNRDNWDQWREITVYGEVDEDRTITFEHEVWDHESNCPFKGSPLTVQVSDNTDPNPQLPALTIAGAEVEEGGTAQFQVTLTGTRTGSVTVDYATVGGTAQQGSDYTHTSRSLTFAANESSKTISVPTVEDDIQEQTESFTVNLSNPSGATIQDGTATGTINDDDDDDGGGNTPTLSIADAAASEGDPVVFTVTLTGARTGSVTVSYATVGGTAQQGSDYTHTSRSLTFAANESSKTISVPTVEDDIQEQTESFTVNLSNPSGATIQDGTATGTINDDDDDDGGGNTPTLSIADAAASEGDPVVFTVTLTGARTGSVTVSYATVGGTAQQGSDYTHTSRSLTFAANESSKTISVPTVEDDIQEQTESFTVNLSNPSGATIQDGTATGTINDDDDDGGGNTPTLSIADAAASEGDPVVFTVTLTGARTGSVTVSYATVGGTDAAASEGDPSRAPTTRTPRGR